MVKRKLRNNGKRPKAFLGLAASVAVPMLVNAGSSLLSSVIGAAGNYASQKSEAEAIADAARSNADALAEQNRINTENQQKMIDFQKGEFEKQRQLMMNTQLNSQIQAGSVNRAARENAARFQLRNGGKRRLNNTPSFLRGWNSPSIHTTDGGILIPTGTTEEGYQTFKAIGDTHNQKHKTSNGSYKTGIGVKVPGKETIEVENGEDVILTPNSLLVNSRRNVGGVFNPVLATQQGMNPIDAHIIQESIKNRKGLKDDGGTKSPVRRLRYAGRHKAASGLDELVYIPNMPYAPIDPRIAIEDSYVTDPNSMAQYILSNTANGNNYGFNIDDIQHSMYNGLNWNTVANLAGAAITGLGNYLGYNRMKGALSDAYKYSANQINQMHGIDTSILSADDYSTGHAMASIQAPRVYTGAEDSAAERRLHRSLRGINNGTLSSAAAQQRRAIAGSDYIDTINQNRSTANKLQQSIIADNMNRITDVSKLNAQLDSQARRDYTTNMLNLLQYNNDIENDKYSMLADAYNRYRLGTAGAYGDMRRTNNSLYGNTLGTIGNNIANTANTLNNWRYGLGVSMLGASKENRELMRKYGFIK